MSELVEDLTGTVWKLKPNKSDDYPGQRDLFVGRSVIPEMWVAAHSRGIFSSKRFSKNEELFCYVKIDGSSDLAGEKFSCKAEIEDALDAALTKSNTGAVVGGGTGLRYSYVDLALRDPDAGIRQIVSVLQEGNITKRAWVLFFDDICQWEWVGIWDDTPPPPGHGDSH